MTGVDISDTAIAFAQQLSTDSGIPATFIRSDVYDWFAQAAQQGQTFDVVFSSYGAIVWLSDIAAWAKGVASVLKPGGKVVVLDFHPYPMIFDWDWKPKHSYFNGAQGEHFANGVGDYVALSGEALTPSGYVEGVKGFRESAPRSRIQLEHERNNHSLDTGRISTQGLQRISILQRRKVV